MKESRNPNGEVYRCLLMLGICFFHSVSASPYNRPWLANLFQCCVNGFAFLSGWYGISFKPSKLLRLYGVGVYCGAVFLAFALCLNIWPKEDPLLVRYAWSYMTDQWFLSAYVMLMFVAPAVNFVVERASVRTLIAIYAPLLLLFGWSWSRSVPIVMDYMPSTSGLGAFTSLSLLASYLFARILRRFQVDQRVSTKSLLMILACTLIGTGVGFGEYSSPFATLQCAVVFLIVVRFQLNDKIGGVARFLGPSMFSVYLLHAGGAAYPLLAQYEVNLCQMGVAVPFVFLLATSTIFVCCVMLDMPRRIILRLLKNPIDGALKSIDFCYETMVDNLIKRMEVVYG